MKKIICGAQSFGYGPISKLYTIVTELKKRNENFVFDFTGDGTSLDFVQNNDPIFDHLKLVSSIDFNKYDLVLSVMEPTLPVKAKVHSVKSIYVDSLYWFWAWPRGDIHLGKDFIQKLIRDPNLIEEVPPHSRQYIAHNLADLSVLQTFDVSNQAETRIPGNNEIEVLPIINLSHRKSHKSNKILVSLSGQISPLNTKEKSMEYLSLIVTIFNELPKELTDKYKIIFTVNPEILPQAKGLLKNPNFNIFALSHTEFLHTLSESLVLFAPAGITTLFEAAYYGTPIFFLPEQHDGHYKNYNRLRGKESEENFNKIFQNILYKDSFDSLDLNPEEEIQKIQKITELYIANDKLRFEKLSVIKEFFSLIISDKAKLANLLEQQRNFVMRNFHKKLPQASEVIEKFIMEESNGK